MPLTILSSWTLDNLFLVVNALRGLPTFSLLLYSLYAICAFREMALNSLSQRLFRTSETDTPEEKDKTIEDVEVQQPRRLSRIDKADQYDSETDISLAALIEAEKGNAIQYRTCSWQKVSSNP